MNHYRMNLEVITSRYFSLCKERIQLSEDSFEIPLNSKHSDYAEELIGLLAHKFIDSDYSERYCVTNLRKDLNDQYVISIRSVNPSK